MKPALKATRGAPAAGSPDDPVPPRRILPVIVLAQFETTRPIAVLLSSDGRVPEPRR